MTERVGLFGWPVEHSVSPPMHNAAFAALGMDWQYELLPTPPDQLQQRVTDLLAQGFRGFNATIPHKQAVLKLSQVTKIASAAEFMQAGNTLVRQQDNSLHVTNTDWRGFLEDLRSHGVDPAGLTCFILGTGGSAQAIAYALRNANAKAVRFVSRQLSDSNDYLSYTDLAGHKPDLIVNCTPVGMYPYVDASPWPDTISIPAQAVVYDLIYNPLETRLMAQARNAGAQAINGLGMLIWQGVFAFEAWTAIQPPYDVMLRAAQQALQHK